MNSSEFNRLMKYAHTNNDPEDVLGEVYDNNLPHPYFNPDQIVFQQLRTFRPEKWVDRKSLGYDKKAVLSDLEYFIPTENLYHNPAGMPDLIENDLLLLSSKTHKDHLWPCEYVFNSTHLSKVSDCNSNTFVEQSDSRPYFADILMGRSGEDHREQLFDLLKTNNQLDNNLINLFGVYKSYFIDLGTGEIDLFFKNQLKQATTEFLGLYFSSQYISKHIQENTWISIVCETRYDNRFFFPTEKTGKALMSGKPFFVLSSKGFLKNLRDIGFKTFSPVIDESYDDIDDLTQRTSAMFNSFMQLQKQDPIVVRQKLQDILVHNEKCMRDKEWLSRDARNILKKFQTPV